MLYLFSFKKLEKPIILSEKRNISLTNISTEYEGKFFVNQFFKYQVNTSLGIIPRYFGDNNSLESIIKIDSGVEFETYAKHKFSMKPDDRKRIENDVIRIEENHSIMNVFLFALSLIDFNGELNESNIYLENLDSNKYQKLESKISVQEFIRYLDFNVIEKDLVNLFMFYDYQYDTYDMQNFIYIGELLEIYHSTKSKYLKFIQLTSIIEFLLIKGDKDIQKQFILKCGILIEKLTNKYKKGVSILWHEEFIPLELGDIYTIRSFIAHGNIIGLANSIKFHKKYKDDAGDYKKILNFEVYFNKLKEISACILRLYIEEPDYIKFLKNN